MTYQHLAWAYALPVKGPAKPVLVALADQSDSDGSCWPGQDRLALMTGLSTKTVERAIKRLELLGLLGRTRRHTAAGYRTSDRYQLHIEVTSLPDLDRLTDTPPTRHTASKAERLQGTPSGDLTDRESVQEELRSSEPPVVNQSSSDADAPAEALAALDIDDLDHLEPPEDPEPTVDACFDLFWHSWPRKVDRKDARKAYPRALLAVGGRRIDAAEFLALTAKRHADHWRDVEHRTPATIPHAATWLNAARWDDELPDPAAYATAPPERLAAVRTLPVAPIVRNRHCQHGYLPGATAPDGSIETCPYGCVPDQTAARS